MLVWWPRAVRAQSWGIIGGPRCFFSLFASVRNSVQDLSSAIKPRAADNGVALAGLRASTAGCSLIALEVSEREVMRKYESEVISPSQYPYYMVTVLVGGREHQKGQGRKDLQDPDPNAAGRWPQGVPRGYSQCLRSG